MFGISAFAEAPISSLASFTQTLVQNARLNNTNTFFPAALQASNTLQPARLTNTNAFYPVDIHAYYPLSPTLLVNANGFYPATLQTSIALDASLLTNSNVFYPATVLPQPVALLPVRVDNQNVLYPPTVVPGPVDLVQIVRYDNVAAFYSPRVDTFVDLHPALYVSPAAFYAAQVQGGSPTPIPYHPHCQRDDMTVEEQARQPMVVKQRPRNTMQPGC